VEEIHNRTRIDPWFLREIEELVMIEDELRAIGSLENVTPEMMMKAKQNGFVDRQLSNLWNTTDSEVRKYRKAQGIEPVFKSVDTCAAEFEAYTPYYYSTYEVPAMHLLEPSDGGDAKLTPIHDDETTPKGDKKRIMILGGGPNRIGQGIEFDYCCVQAAIALRKANYEVIMVNSNPETVSTDYDTSDHLFFEPLTSEDVLNIYERMKPDGVIVQFGGQTPLNLARVLEVNGVKIIGTSVADIEVAEDRKHFSELITKLGLKQPSNGICTDLPSAIATARKIGFPAVVRPSFVLGGRAMEIVYNEEALARYMTNAIEVSPNKPILIDRFLENAVEVDVDCLCDGHRTVIGGVMQHIEEAGIHSGDSACVIPPYSMPADVIMEIKRQTRLLADALHVKGLMNIQFAVTGLRPGRTEKPEIYVLEANPRASRTIPFVSKATGVPLARLAALVMVDQTLDQLGVAEEVIPKHYSVKESVFPFNKFMGIDIVLGPEMKSTGEVMGIDAELPLAFAKAQLAASSPLPAKGTIFFSIAGSGKKDAVPIARQFTELGFRLLATPGTANVLKAGGVPVDVILKIAEGRPNILDKMKNNEIALVINTPAGRGSHLDEGKIRAAAVTQRITCITTLSAAEAAVQAIQALRDRVLTVTPLQDWFPQSK